LTNWLLNCGLPSRLIGGTRLYVVAEVMAWLDEQDGHDAHRLTA
jgi:hypothetical protein